jgi:hypothetical protein
MSRWVIAKLDIDVIVQLAWLGPAEATDWRPLTDDPDALGTALWRLNYEVPAYEDEDPPRPEYHFAPLPITITAIEGLKQCAYYEYQTATDDEVWEESEVAELLHGLRGQLLDADREYADAPWGWEGKDVADRAGRPAPQMPTPVVQEALSGAVGQGVRAGRPTGATGLRLPVPRGLHRVRAPQCGAV